MDENDENNNCEQEINAASWVLDFINSSGDSDGGVLPDTLEVPDTPVCTSGIPSEYNGLKIYQESLAKFQPATASENRALLKNWRDFASESAMVRLVEGNLHLVVSVARFYAGFYSEIDEQDLITIGYDGLRSAIEHFDSNEETPFNSYASFWIKQAMQRYIIKNLNVVYIPGNRRVLLHRLESYLSENKLNIKNSYELSTDHRNKIMQTLEISERTLNSLFRIPLVKQLDLQSSYLLKNGRTTSLAEFCKQIIDESGSSSQEEYRIIVARLYEALSQLEARESLIIKLRFGLFSTPRCLTLEEVSQKLGRTRERIRQIEQEALKKLKSLLEVAYEDYREKRDPIYKIQFLDYELVTNSSDDLLHALCDIFDFEQIPLTFGEIRQRLKRFYPGRFIPDSLLRKLLTSRSFFKYEVQSGETMWQLDHNGSSYVSPEVLIANEEKLSTKSMEFDENLDLLLEKDNDLSILYMGDFSDDMEEDEDTEAEEITDSENSADDIIKMFSF